MFGLNKKNNKKGPSPFTFDLEKDMQDPEKQKKLLHKVEDQIGEIKKALREGADSEEFEKLGLLLHGYSALLKVLTKHSN